MSIIIKMPSVENSDPDSMIPYIGVDCKQLELKQKLQHADDDQEMKKSFFEAGRDFNAFSNSSALQITVWHF